jgi:predicted amidophosphoribosyltransferase
MEELTNVEKRTLCLRCGKDVPGWNDDVCMDCWWATPVKVAPCPECGERDCRWWGSKQAHELATRGMQRAILRQEGLVDDDGS